LYLTFPARRQSVPTLPVYDPEEVIDTIVRLASEPKDNVAVGAAAKAAIMAHHIAPGLTESMMAKRVHKSHDAAPPATPTEGAVRTPTATGTEVSGGWRRK